MTSVSYVSQKELARLLGLTTRQINNLVAEGMPQEATGRIPKYPVPGAIQWYVAHKAQSAKDEARPANLDEARARREAALAQQEELKLAEMRKELMTVEDYRRVVDDTNARIAARLKALPQKLAPAVVGVKDTSEGLACVQPLVDEVMDELYRAEDVPTEEAA